MWTFNPYIRIESGAAAFFAMREYEKHQAENGQPPSHQFAKELMAGIAGAEVRHCRHCRHDITLGYTAET